MAAATILCASAGWVAEATVDSGSWKLTNSSKK